MKNSFGVALASLALALCGVSCAPVKHAGQVVVDCITADQVEIKSLILSFLPMFVGGAPDWTAIEGQAIAAGEAVGGCALAELVQEYLAPPPGRAAPAPAVGQLARTALEDFRVHHAGGAVFRSRMGDL